MEITPEDIIESAHRHERYAQFALGLADADVVGFAPRELRGTGTRAAYVEGLRSAARQTRDQVVRAHLDMADALYWCLARRSVHILRPRRRCLADNDADADQEGLLWLLKAAQRFRPGAGPWKRYAISWLMAGSVRKGRGGLSDHDREVLARLRRLTGQADAAGRPLARVDLARAVGRPVDYVDWLLAASAPTLVLGMGPDDVCDPIDTGRSPTGAGDEGHALISLDLALARVTPREAWALARQAGLWGTTGASLRTIGIELGLPPHRVGELVHEARQHIAQQAGQRDPALWPFDQRGLRWSLTLWSGLAESTQIAAREGVPLALVEQSVAACLDDVGVQAPERRERVA